MSLHRLRVVFVAGVLLAASIASAQDAKSEPIVYDFGEDLVHGSAKSSRGEVLHVRKRSMRESLVRVREHWLPELYRAAEEL